MAAHNRQSVMRGGLWGRFKCMLGLHNWRESTTMPEEVCRRCNMRRG